jgi:hypothetical protein
VRWRIGGVRLLGHKGLIYAGLWKRHVTFM